MSVQKVNPQYEPIKVLSSIIVDGGTVAVLERWEDWLVPGVEVWDPDALKGVR